MGESPTFVQFVEELCNYSQNAPDLVRGKPGENLFRERPSIWKGAIRGFQPLY
jgi:hypothetical protein